MHCRYREFLAYVGRVENADSEAKGLRTLLDLAREGPVGKVLDEAGRHELIAVGELELSETRGGNVRHKYTVALKRAWSALQTKDNRGGAAGP